MTSRTLILLTLNEVEGVRAMTPKIPKDQADEIIAVDGGSTDGTVEAYREAGIQVISQKNKGRGDAFHVGINASMGRHIVFFSPDGNEDPADIPKLFEALEQGADMVIASRFLPGSRNEEDDQALPLRKWVNMAFTRIANLLWNRGPFVTDTINGFRGLTRDTFDAIRPRSSGYSIEYEMTIHAMKKKLRIVEIPTIESARIAGETKAPSFKTGIIFLRLLASEIFSKN